MIAIGLLISAGAAAEDAAVTVETGRRGGLRRALGSELCRVSRIHVPRSARAGWRADLPYQAFVATAHGANLSLLDQVARISGR